MHQYKQNISHHFQQLVALILFLAPISQAQSASLCHALDQAFTLPQLAINSELAPLEIDADEGESLDRDTMEFIGDVEIRRGNQHLQTDKARYTRSQDRIQADGNIIYREPDFSLFGDNADINIDTFEGEINQADVRFPETHARADADTVILEGRETIRLVNGSYTTCDVGDNSWSLTSPRIKLDRAKDVGEAYHAVLRIKSVPVFYAPYINFPLSDKRKSGFLAPRFGTSDESGTEIFIPYYWNIAPNYDATITPRFLERRGVQLQNEFRYLTESHSGTLDAEYLPSDNLFGDDRSLIRLRHKTDFSRQWRGDLLFAEVSDSEYLEDLGDSLAITSITHLERRADLNYDGDWGSLLTRVQDFQTVDDTIAAGSRPYKRLPQLVYNSPRIQSWWNIDQQLRSEWVQFDRDDSVTAARLDIQPTLSRRFERSWGFFEPRVKLRHTQYQLDDQAVGIDDSQSRTVPISTLDGGLFFDKPFTLGKRAFVHTLEPRLFYLYVPFRDQDDIPLFDTGVNNFRFGQLFNDNRFSGGDRIGDANQLTLALTSRLINDLNGQELATLAIGQIRHFRDRRVTPFSGGAPDTDNTSDFVAQLDINPTNSLTLTGEWQWDPDNEESVLSAASLKYRPAPGRGLNLSYRSRGSALEQTDVSFFWPLSRRWRAVGRWNYSLEENQTLESFAGIEYEQCCWRLSFVRREFINDDDATNDDTNTAFLIQLELKGLTRVGSPVDALLEDGILDYRR